MLIIQDIMLDWNKPERGGKFAEARNKFDFAFPIESKPGKSDECLLDVRRYYQKGGKFLTLEELHELLGSENFIKFRNNFALPTKLSELKIKNLEFTEIDVKIQVDFSYDPQINGKPHRHGHNKDYNNEKSRFFCRDVLNETAFTLETGQKGRILYNARFVDWDTGEHWYEKTVINIANVKFEEFRSDIFLSQEFDFVYDKLESLY